MRTSWLCRIGCILAVGLFGELSARAQADEKRPLFETDVLPLLRERCLKCHGVGKVKGGLDLRNRPALLEGGDTGPAVVPGKPGDSLLLQRIEKGEMPPAKGEALTAAQRALLHRWIAAGAPSSGKSVASSVSPAARVSEEDRRFWAFQPPRRPAVPGVVAKERIRNPIDAFLLAQLEAKGMTYRPDAAREVLLRRVCLDLTGLPPTPEQVAAFRTDTHPDAYERLVDRLLASPEYGERYGRHWLDVAGYADSDGYLAADRVRPEAWRYRDYVIQALNDDIPYDRFVVEQLAGDELSDWRRAETLNPAMIRQLAATGFLRTASDPTYPGYTEPNEIHQVIGDTMQIVGSAFLGLTMQCARCHEHKFDPIAQRDYYALQTIFLPALDPTRWQPSEVRGVRLASTREQTALQQHNSMVNARIKTLNVQLGALKKKAGKTPNPDIARLQEQIKRAQAEKKQTPPLLRALTDLDGKCPDGRLLRRGDHRRPGAVVEPGVPEVLAPPGYHLTIEPGFQTTGRRLALARWLTRPDQPLTARVQVNRMWAHHFGRGLVPTVANFGRSGARPTHPELLDWLATEFVRAGWSMKALHRLMVTSTAYRLAAATDAKKGDALAALYGAWRPRRLEGEAIRDSMLAVAGRLSAARFGPPTPVRAHGDGSIDTADDERGNRRSIYLMVRRSQHLTLLDLFDTPMMEINCPERPVSTVPLQALALLHSPFTQRNAEALARRLLASAGDDDGRLDHAFRLVYTRAPSPRERDLFRRFLADVRAEANTARPSDRAALDRAAWTQAALVLLNSNEFLYVP